MGKSVDGKTGEGKFTIFVGGNLIGTRMNVVFKDLVPQSEIVSTLRPLLAAFKDHRYDGKTLGDFFNRCGVEKLQELCVTVGP